MILPRMGETYAQPIGSPQTDCCFPRVAVQLGMHTTVDCSAQTWDATGMHVGEA